MGSADLAGRIDTVERRMDSQNSRWEAAIAELSTQVLRSNRETREAVLATLRGEVAGEFATQRTGFEKALATQRADVAQDFATQRTDFKEALAAQRADVASEFAAQRTHFETILADGLSETRRYMRVLYEDILSRIALIGENRSSPS
jgi:hypothetical protein